MEEEIKKLKEELKLEKAIKDSEVILNKELLTKVKILETQLESVLKINADYEQKIAKYKLVIDRLNYSRV
jgi:hypothetical protein